MQVGVIETTAKLLGFEFADGIVKDFMKNDKMRDTMKDIMMSFLQVFGYESQKHDEIKNVTIKD